MSKITGLFCALVVMLGVSLFISTSLSADVVTGLVGYWSFDTGTAKDDSGKGNHGVIIGAPKVVDGKVGKAFDFDGKDDGVTVPDSASLQLPDALTVAAWIYVRKFVDHAGVCWKGEKIGWGANFNWRIATTGDGLTWGTTTGGTENWFATAGAIKLNEWNFVALTADGTQAVARVAPGGGALTIPTSGEGNPKPSPKPYNVWKDQPVRIGWSQGRNGDLAIVDYFDGIIDEVTIYNRALSEADLNELKDQGVNRLTAVDLSGKLATKWAQIKTY